MNLEEESILLKTPIIFKKNHLTSTLDIIFLTRIKNRMSSRAALYTVSYMHRYYRCRKKLVILNNTFVFLKNVQYFIVLKKDTKKIIHDLYKILSFRYTETEYYSLTSEQKQKRDILTHETWK